MKRSKSQYVRFEGIIDLILYGSLSSLMWPLAVPKPACETQRGEEITCISRKEMITRNYYGPPARFARSRIRRHQEYNTSKYLPRKQVRTVLLLRAWRTREHCSLAGGITQGCSFR